MKPVITFSGDYRYVTITNLKQSVDSRGAATWYTATRRMRRPASQMPFFRPAGGVRRWAALNGHDDNEGTSDRPFRTVRRLIAAAQAGDVLTIRPGTYTEALPALTRIATTPERPLVITCAPGAEGLVTIERPADDVKLAPWRSVLTIADTRHVTINGLFLQGAVGMDGAPVPGKDSLNACGVLFSNGSAHCEVLNCIVSGSTHCGIKEAGHGGNHIKVRGCVILNNGIGKQDHGIYLSTFDSQGDEIDGNLILDNPGAGVHLYGEKGGPDDVSVTWNVIAGNTDQILIAGARARVHNNTCTGGYAGLRLYNAGCFGAMIYRNIFAFHSAYEGINDRAGANNATDANCWYGSQAGFGGGFAPTGVAVRTHPLFVDIGTGNYELRANSPCLSYGAYG